jgi:uncharacterized membrane protein
MREHSVAHSVAKTFSYFIVDSLLTGLIALVVTRDAGDAISIGLGVQIAEVLLYYFHERVWARFFHR